MREIVLPRSTEKSGAVDFGDIHHRHLVPVPHDGELTQAREKGLDMVGNADTERIVNGVRHAVLNRQPVTLHETLETRDTRLAAPRPEAKGIEMVDAVGYAEPLDERREPDTAGDHEDREPPSMFSTAPRSQLRNSSTRFALPSARYIRLRKIGSSSMTRRTGW